MALSKSGWIFSELMLQRYMDINGYLAEFLDEIRPERTSDEAVADRCGREELEFQPEFFKHADEFLSLIPFPGDLIQKCSDRRFHSDDEVKTWFSKMVEISRAAYFDEISKQREKAKGSEA